MSFLRLVTDALTGRFESLYDFLTHLKGDVLESWAETMGLPLIAFLIAGLVLSIGLGFFGYKLIKLVLSLSAAGFGFAVGYEAIMAMESVWFREAVAIASGAVFALLLLWLTFGRSSYVWFSLVFLFGAGISLNYLNDSWFTAAFVGLSLGLLSILVFRWGYILLSSALCACFAVGFLYMLAPEASVFYLGTIRSFGPVVVMAMAALMALAQLLMNPPRRYKYVRVLHKPAASEKEEAPAPEQKRRSKDKKAKRSKKTDDEPVSSAEEPVPASSEL